MAKKQDTEEREGPNFIELPRTVDPEKEALRQRIAELESVLRRFADEKEAALERPNPDDNGVRNGFKELSYWHVKLEHQPDRIVEAYDRANAEEAYFKMQGALRSEFRCEATPASKEQWDAQEAKRAAGLL